MRAAPPTNSREPRYEFNEAAKRRGIRFDTAVRAALDDADLVVVSCYPFDDGAQYAALLDAVARPEQRLVVDGNPRAGMLADRATFLANFEDLAARSLLVKVGDEDAELLLGDSLDEFVRRLGADAGGGGAVLATAGRAGADLHADGSSVHADIVTLPGPVIDTMGAGDATLSAVVHHIATNGVPQTTDAWTDALHEAMTIAAATVRHEGALLRTPAHDPVFPS